MLSLKAWKIPKLVQERRSNISKPDAPTAEVSISEWKMLWTVIQSLTHDGRSINLIHPTDLNPWPPHGRWMGVVQSMVACHPVLKNASVGTLARLWILKVLVDLVHCLADLYPHWTAVIFQVQKNLLCAAGTAILPCSGHNHMAWRETMQDLNTTFPTCCFPSSNEIQQQHRWQLQQKHQQQQQQQ